MPSEREKMLAGQPYRAMDPELVAARERARALCARLNATAPDHPRQRAVLDQLLGAAGARVAITPPFHCDYGTQIELGDDVFLNFNCVLLDVCRIAIGAHTLLGPAVQVYTPLHPMDARQRREQESGRPVTIGSDVWIGGGAIVLPGVTIGDRAVIGAGSVVTRDVPADVFAAGNPCRVLRPLGPQDPAGLSNRP
ncbi:MULTISPECIES: sugar O-acetyltransferase [Ramlibacter]|uniref:Nodulation protein L n=1 Tax=Ramlibacter pinisoli TaxID=2682844 RepID=A0A6N8IWF2_9BURK|nr:MULTISPECIES: sugar O-acetyltransferase [Ramlibacter]MBA2961058.1 sugar O-acetyltransferase [Ramlibacter sp. CGMCC 1.13660]MVQ31002.1 sugar O-acetyltransferase [Ramlibacter pinisoli]